MIPIAFFIIPEEIHENLAVNPQAPEFRKIITKLNSRAA